MLSFPVAPVHEQASKRHNSPNRMFLLGRFEGRVGAVALFSMYLFSYQESMK